MKTDVKYCAQISLLLLSIRARWIHFTLQRSGLLRSTLLSFFHLHLSLLC